MKNLKLIFGAFLMAGALFALVACNGNEGSSEEAAEETTEQAEEAAPAEETAPAPDSTAVQADSTAQEAAGEEGGEEQ